MGPTEPLHHWSTHKHEKSCDHNVLWLCLPDVPESRWRPEPPPNAKEVNERRSFLISNSYCRSIIQCFVLKQIKYNPVEVLFWWCTKRKSSCCIASFCLSTTSHVSCSKKMDFLYGTSSFSVCLFFFLTVIRFTYPINSIVFWCNPRNSSLVFCEYNLGFIHFWIWPNR